MTPDVDVEIEEVPTPQTRSQMLVDPRLEREAVEQQQKLFVENAKLAQLKRMESSAKRWDIVNKTIVPVVVFLIGAAVVLLALIVLNWVAAGFWRNTFWN